MKKLLSPEEGIYIEKKSKFICHLFKVSDTDQIQEIIRSEKKKYFDARHHCYAYILGDDGKDYKCSDDGEPSGTAGKPMLEILQREGLTDILCVVTRYFGGTLLGTGGLVRAYSESLKDAIGNSSFELESEAVISEYRYSYNFDAKIASFLREKDVKVISTEYTDSVILKIAVPLDTNEEINSQIVNITNGTAEQLSSKNEMFSF
ncbi:MAG: YigZ family protein [Lachnospiraceae bacterium]|nr:YigZ family protein [Lachnospiraceae bacterium]